MALLAACGSSAGSGGTTTTTSTQSAAAVTGNTWTDSVDPTAIPLGDGNVSTQAKQGYVFSCQTQFGGGGAQRAGPWIDPVSMTWNQKTKLTVRGSHLESSASYHESVQGSTRTITSDDLPVDTPHGTFPIAASDPAYQYDRNPNSITAQSISYQLPASPTAAQSPYCVGLGAIGITVDGVLLFNALDAAGRDAGAHELQDSCGGHPQMSGAYHYHAISACLMHAAPNTSQLIGYAIDGYGIYAEWNAAGKLPTDKDLDACHGRTSAVQWNGAVTTIYHYDVSVEYPYTVGCYHGTPAQP